MNFTPHTFIIAEAGVNHNGSLKLAYEMIDAAAIAGADAVKFQTFKADKLVTKIAPKAGYQVRADSKSESQYEMLKSLELNHSAHIHLAAYAKKKSIRFLSSPFDKESVDMLIDLGVDRIKLGSGELTNIPLLQHIAHIGCPVILSTGMSTLDEVAMAVDILTTNDLTLLHCVTSYPAPVEASNLLAMKTMRDAFNVPVGWSDHTMGISVSIAAVAMGACVIEKHFTLDRTLPGPDHAASLEADELTLMVRSIRDVEAAIGDGVKKPALCEYEIRDVARKSIVSAKKIKRGEVLSRSMIDVRRPGNGISPIQLEDIVGQTVNRDIDEGTLLTMEMLE
jgi:N,N'-diacetyllegionaminate synthase